MSNDVYAISGRIKNLIAKKDLALSPTGLILVNAFTLMLKDLYEYADNLTHPNSEALRKLLEEKESLPAYVIEVSTPKEPIEDPSGHLRFDSNEEALKYFTDEFERLGGEKFWLEAESASIVTDKHYEVMVSRRNREMAKYLTERENKDG